MEQNIEQIESRLNLRKLVWQEPTFVRKVEIGERLIAWREQQRLLLKAKRRALPRLGAWWMMGSAAAVLAIVLGVATYRLSDYQLNAAQGGVTHELPDGSRVELKQDAQLSYNRLSWLWKRELRLEGSGFFEVAKGKRFVVQTQAGNVVVLGTKFLVEQEGETLYVECEEGTVRVKSPKGECVLEAGQQVNLTGEGLGEVEETAQWPDVLYYEGDPLVNVLADVEHIFRVRIEGDSLCEDLTFDGGLPTTDLEEALKTLCKDGSFTYRLKGRTVIINSSCP